jgi:hypothetical protein
LLLSLSHRKSTELDWITLNEGELQTFFIDEPVSRNVFNGLGAATYRLRFHVNTTCSGWKLNLERTYGRVHYELWSPDYGK